MTELIDFSGKAMYDFTLVVNIRGSVSHGLGAISLASYSVIPLKKLSSEFRG
jgi:hypothetical protein